MIDWLLERLHRARTLDSVVVATSTDTSDDPLEDHCRALGVACFRGPLDDVCERMLDAAEAFGIEIVVRISGDSPLLHPAIVEQGLAHWRASDNPDLVTNVFPRTFPTGQSVEVFDRDRLRTLHDRFTDRHHHEHVTSFLYENAGLFRVVNFNRSSPYFGQGMSIDTQADFERIDSLLARMKRAHWEYELEELLTLVT